jgi:hypothetical protein
MRAIPYKDRDKSFIVVKEIFEPYGPGTDSVVSVGCTLKGDVEDPTWKVHIPKNILGDVIQALKDGLDNE